MPASLMNTSHLKEVMSIDKPNSGRDTTGPAEISIGNASGTTSRNMRYHTDIVWSGTGDEPEEPAWVLHLDRGNARIHAGKLYLADLARNLPARFVKRIDQFALRVLKSPVGRYCL
jgi:hypothetical protein